MAKKPPAQPTHNPNPLCDCTETIYRDPIKVTRFDTPAPLMEFFGRIINPGDLLTELPKHPIKFSLWRMDRKEQVVEFTFPNTIQSKPASLLFQWKDEKATIGPTWFEAKAHSADGIRVAVKGFSPGLKKVMEKMLIRLELAGRVYCLMSYWRQTTSPVGWFEYATDPVGEEP